MPARILITEDEMLVALDLSNRLSRLGYDVCATVPSGEEALEGIASLKPDLVLMDIQLQGALDGIETAARVRKEFGIPIIFLTANADEKTLQRAQLTHAASYLLKPFKERELQICIELALTNHALQKQVQQARDHLEQRVAERTAQLAEANASLQAEIRVREHTELQLREKAALLDKARDAIYVRTLEGQVTFWNRSAETLYGHPARTAIGQLAAHLTGSADDDAHRQALATTLADGAWTGELRHHSLQGIERLVESRWTLVRDETTHQPTSILVVNTDMTERKKIEAQFLRAQRLESIGSLASGIAHDLNNVFTPLIMSGQLLSDVPLEDADRRMVDIMLASAKRGADMVKQVLLFVRGTEGEREPFPLEHLTKEVHHLIEQTFPRSIRIRSRFGPNLPLVLGDVTRLHQVLMNLCVNARDAMESGGELLLSIEECAINEDEAAREVGVRAGAFLRLTVADTGPGMSSETLAKIFDPFFTTKAPGKGTGLGLATVTTILRDHGGFLRVQTAPGAGAQFHVYLPVAVESLLEEPLVDRSAPWGDGQCILLVDDDLSVREIMKVALEAQGYTTLSACDGTEALAVTAAHGDEIACVVIDLMMPHLDGMAAGRALRKMHPGMPMLLVSGLDAVSLPTASLEENNIRILPKPFTREELLVAIHRTMELGSVCDSSVTSP